MADEFCLKILDFHVTFRDLLQAVNLRHGTNGFTSLPKEGVLTAWAGFEPSNLGTKGQHATSRPPKPLIKRLQKYLIYVHIYIYVNLHTVSTSHISYIWFPCYISIYIKTTVGETFTRPLSYYFIFLKM